MITDNKRMPWLVRVMLVAVVSLFAAATGLLIARSFPSSAEEQGNIGRTYFKQELKNSELAQRFYDVIAEMADDGGFNDGKYTYDLSNVLSQDEIADYVESSSPKIPVAFGAARDAFYMDHPDLFYADVYKLYFTAGMTNGKYVAFIDSGRADNYYVDNTVNTAAEVNAAVEKYEAAITALVAAAKSAGDGAVKQIEYVNNKLATDVAYDYGAYNDAHNNVAYDGYVNTAYGALVNKKAMCGGYARAFKAVMDRLDIPCVLIQGTSYSGKSAVDSLSKEELQAGLEAHMWNAVLLDGLWYGVDVTWNSAAVNKEQYLLVGDDALSVNHFEDGVISSSGFELKYPALRPFDYGVDEDGNGFAFKDSGAIGDTEFGYIQDKDVPERYSLVIGVSYNGKNSAQLADDGLYLAYRYYQNDAWTDWIDKETVINSMGLDEEQLSSFYAEDYNIESIGNSTQKVQYAIIDCAPNNGFYYDVSELTYGGIRAVSSEYTNDAYKKFIPAPYVKSMTPDVRGYLMKLDPIKITIEYSEQLVLAEGKTKNDVGVSVTSPQKDIEKYIKVEDIEWNEESNTLSFVFTPSKYFAHNCVPYYLVPTNLIGKESLKVPEAGRIAFKMKQVICPKVFNDGRLYMQVFGHPKFVGAEDMSMNKFMDKNGQPIVGNQRSQMMLVINEPSKAETDEMIDKSGLKDGQLMASSTYQIDLQMCGLVQRVPDGSYMQVGFGFPEGYGPDSAGVTFTVYHYTRNPDGTIKDSQAIPCVVTEYGIIATVKSFSPFMICAVKSDETLTDRSVYASVNGIGGSINETTIKTIGVNESVSYVLTADDGYKLDRVLLNGKDITDTVEGGVLTVAYDKLGKDNAKGNSDVIEISFVSERAAKYYADNNIEVKQPNIVVKPEDIFKAVSIDASGTPAPDKNGVKTGIIITIVVLVMILTAGAVAATVIFTRKANAAKASTGKKVSTPPKKRK